jgi:DNA-binding transcriptional ArsR family regulator
MSGAAEPAQPAADAVLDALGEPTRRRIVELLSAGEQPAGAVVAALQERMAISQPAVSQHLRALRDAGLVSVRADGARRLYALDAGGVDAARAWLAALADPFAGFAQPLDALETEIARGRRAARRADAAPDAERPRRRRSA